MSLQQAVCYLEMGKMEEATKLLAAVAPAVNRKYGGGIGSGLLELQEFHAQLVCCQAARLRSRRLRCAAPLRGLRTAPKCGPRCPVWRYSVCRRGHASLMPALTLCDAVSCAQITFHYYGIRQMSLGALQQVSLTQTTKRCRPSHNGGFDVSLVIRL